MKGVCDTCLGLAHKLLPEFVHAVYLVMLSYPNALPHPNCFPSIYAYSKVNLRSFSAADRPSDDLTVEADLEQAPGVKGNCYKACCAVRPLPLALAFCISECLYRLLHTLTVMPHSNSNLHTMLRFALMGALH